MSDLFSSAGLAGDIERLQRQVTSLFDGFPNSIRAARFGAFPRINIGSTDDSIEIVAFARGVDPANLEVSIDKGLLTISLSALTGLSRARSRCRKMPIPLAKFDKGVLALTVPKQESPRSASRTIDIG